MSLTGDSAVQFRWLGVEGIELRAGDRVLVIDPYFTRFPTWKLWFWRVSPDRLLIAEKIQRCDLVLVTHAHFDHIMDVPDVARYTGAMVMGSPNSCRLLAACGVPGAKIREIGVGDKLALKDFQVQVLRTEHPRIPGFSPGRLAPDLTPPLRARDYRMDEHFGFLIEVHGRRVLMDPGTRPGDGVAADALFVYPGLGSEYYESLLHLVQPKVVVPIHWEDFFRRLTQPLRPYWKLPRRAWPPLQRIDLGRFKGMVEGTAPGTVVFEPEIFRTYDLRELL